MTVAELLAALQDMPQDVTVFRMGRDTDEVVTKVTDESHYSGARIVMLR